MGNYQQRPNTGILFKNDRKESDTHPDYTGSALIGDQEYFMDAWIKTGKESGKKFMSFSFKPKGRKRVEEEDVDQSQQSRPKHRPPPPPPSGRIADPDEDDGGCSPEEFMKPLNKVPLHPDDPLAGGP
jgi:hypothetical protein